MATRRTSKRKSSKRASSRRPVARAAMRPNYTPPKRGYVFEPRPGEFDEETGELNQRGRIREEMIKKLASEWNEANERMEARSFMSDEEKADEADYHAERAMDYAWNHLDDEDHAEENSPRVKEKLARLEDEYYSKLAEREREDFDRRDIVEGLLSELGARMSRPYEHWNEEESYREWAERDRDDDY